VCDVIAYLADRWVHIFDQGVLFAGKILDALSLLSQSLQEHILPIGDAVHPPEAGWPAERADEREPEDDFVSHASPPSPVG
jgi:hypothetical protein